MSWFALGEETDNPDCKKLIVELFGGRDITDPKTRSRKDGPQLCDVFCTLRFDNIKYSTEIIKTTMNPQWQTSFEFPIEKCLDSAVVEISCYHNGLVSNTFLGEVRIPVAEHRDVAFEYSQLHWFPLFNPKHRKKDGGAGELGIKVGAKGGDITIGTQRTEMGEHLYDRTAEEIYEEANYHAIEGNKSAVRSLRLAEQARDIQANTVLKLREQGHQIERIQTDIDCIHNNMDQSERKLRSIESVWGTFANKVTAKGNATNYKKKAHKERKIIHKRKKEEDANRKIKQKGWEEQHKAVKNNVSRKRDAMINNARKAEVGSQEEQFYAIIDNTDEQLTKLGTILDDIKDISLDMGVELNEQNDRLDGLRIDVDKASHRMDSATRRSRAILHS